MNFLKNESFRKLLSASFYIIVGILVCIFPAATKIFLCYVFGGILIAAGIVKLLRYYFFTNLKLFIFNGPTAGYLAIAIGLALIIFSGDVVKFYPFIIGSYLGLKGIGKIIRSQAYRLVLASKWIFDLVTGVVQILLAGTLIIIDETLATDVLVYCIGGCLIIQGLISGLSMIFISKNMDEIKRVFNDKKESYHERDDYIDVE